jgi:hypothetical protein
MSYGATGGGDDGSASTPSGGGAPPTAQRPAAWQSTIRGLHTMQYMEDGQAESMGRAAIEEARQRSQRSNSSFSRRGDGSASGGSTQMALPNCCSVDGVLSRTPLIYALLLNGGLVVALIGCNDAKSAWSDLGLLSAPSSYSAKMQWARHVYQVGRRAMAGMHRRDDIGSLVACHSFSPW